MPRPPFDRPRARAHTPTLNPPPSPLSGPQVLNEIHKRYYYALSSSAGNGTGTGKPTRRPDVKEIIDRLKRKVLAGVTVVFSGVIPLGVRPESCVPPFFPDPSFLPSSTLARTSRDWLADCRVRARRLRLRPNRFEWWRTAEAFGATCSLRVDGSTTHLIATKVRPPSPLPLFFPSSH